MQEYFAKDKKDNKLFLKQDDLYHIKNVMRMKENDEIIVVYEDTSYICNLNKDLISCNIKEVFKENNSVDNLIIYVPMLPDEKMSFIFKYLTQMGASEFIVVEYTHCKFKLPKKDYEKKLIRWNKIIKEASEQSYRTNIPLLEKIISYKDIESIGDVNILCSLDNSDVKSICQVLTQDNCNDKISLVFGPEGGLSKEEESFLVEKNFIKTSLGNTVLRTEIVPVMISSIIKYLKG